MKFSKSFSSKTDRLPASVNEKEGDDPREQKAHEGVRDLGQHQFCRIPVRV